MGEEAPLLEEFRLELVFVEEFPLDPMKLDAPCLSKSVPPLEDEPRSGLISSI